MILSLPIERARTQARKSLHWKQEIKHSIYTRNKEALKNHQDRNDKQKGQKESQLHAIDKSLMRLTEQVEEMRVRDDCTLDSFYSYYSFYLPLRQQIRLENELSMAFSCLKRLEDANCTEERSLLMIEISEFMKDCAQRGEVDAGWQRCLQKYVCELDSLRALEVFLEVKKRGGVRSSRQLYEQFDGKCMMRIFFQRVHQCEGFLDGRKQVSTLEMSLEESGEVNEVSMPQTMKNLFCWICLLYDCTQHNSDPALRNRDFNFAAPNNLIPQKQQIQMAYTLLTQYQHLLKEGTVPKNGPPCSPKCYQDLTKASWEELQARRGKLLAPVVKGAIKMGIYMYSYSPCQLWFLLADRSITCAMAFLFLLEDCNLGAKLERRMEGSQAEALLRVGRQGQGQVRHGRGGRGRQRVRVAHTEQNCEITACAHYFLGEGLVDSGCEACACKERTFCLPECLCASTCPLRRRGCHCRKEDCRTEKCPCFKRNDECDPTLCFGCFNKKDCKNHQILDGGSKRVRIGKSTISEAGLGLFAREQIHKGEMLSLYSGELIDNSVDLMREHFSVDSSFYNFSSKEGSIDARFRGNTSRFINHGDQGKDNLYAHELLTGGRFKVAFFANREIQPDEEFFFDYDGEGKLFKYYKEKYPFIRAKKNKEKQPK